jgi:hypothetical protein
MAEQDSNVERKTPGVDPNPNARITPGTGTYPVANVDITGQGAGPSPAKPKDPERNILHKFRTFTYNFTLAALPPNAHTDNNQIKSAIENHVVLKSAGKKSGELKGGNKAEGFNAKDGSPGRFDMFINNVEIDTLMSATNATNMSMATKISFDVFEPLSINGFMEALQVSAEAAGNVNYVVTAFALKMEFIGYTDAEDGPSTQLENAGDQGTRYFVIMITKVEAKMDENGTRYQVKAIARNEMAYADDNGLKESIQMKGANVVEICQSLIDSLNIAAKEAADAESSISSPLYDSYEIKFPTPNWSSGEFDYNTPYKKFTDARITELSNNPSIFTYPAPGTVKSAYDASPTAADYAAGIAGGGRGFVNPPLAVTINSQGSASNPAASGESSSYDPNMSSVLFVKGAKIHDIIASVIRDSDFGRNIIKAAQEQHADQFIEYFHVSVETEIKDKWNTTTLQPTYIYRYIVLPYKMHFSRIPLFQKELSTSEQNSLIKNYVRRTYEYLYTGKNVDVRSFNLVFNHLYFQAYPRSMNNAEFGVDNAKDNASEKTGVTLTPVSGSAESSASTVPLSPRVSDPRRANIVGPGGNAIRPEYDSYDALVKNMHQAILDNLSMVTCDLEILGDPYFLCTGGIGNFRPKIINSTITDNGEAPYQVHNVMVVVEFRNPEDIDPNTGMAIFNNARRVPFNGCYQVSKVVSKFQDGLFTQRLKLMRVPGQPIVVSGRGGPPSSSPIFASVPLPSIASSSSEA